MILQIADYSQGHTVGEKEKEKKMQKIRSSNVIEQMRQTTEDAELSTLLRR